VIAATLVTESEEETSRAGESLSADLRPGDVVLLYGQLGAGKTAFVRGLARGLGASPDDVSSPTFTLIQEYAGSRATVYHVDLYRLEPNEIDDLGLEELMSGGGVVAVEWADRWAGRPEDACQVWIEDAGDERRAIRIGPAGSSSRSARDAGP
jgi:tRNA threonylcarbamoyladenosine biosynthesis protein TsaE